MLDFNMDEWTYGPLIVIAILYFLWRFLKPGSKRSDRNRDFRTRYQERKRGATDGVEKEEEPKPYREKWNSRRKF